MDFDACVNTLRQGKSLNFPPEANALQYAKELDAQGGVVNLRDRFIIPTKGSLRRKSLNVSPCKDATEANGEVLASDDNTASIYFVGNSLGAQPKAVRPYFDAHLSTWAAIGVNGHFTTLEGSPLTSWQDMAENCARKSTDLVGAFPSEIAIMNTLTANLHLLMASFYRPTEARHKIIIEWRPFPSDWYAFQSQIEWHGFSPASSLIEIQPDDSLYLSTAKILATVDKHADSTALLLLPGIQHYTGQLFEIPLITRYARERGITVGWDLAHAAGNVELFLHDWDVDFAVWCTYKYINAGPGSIAGAFVHERHGGIAEDGTFRHRLAGWYGADKRVRFNMDKEFHPTVGAGGFQLSNPSAVDLASLSAALEVFGMTSMERLRSKALVLTAYLEWLLDQLLAGDDGETEKAFRIITPRNPLERGTQLSLLLREGLVETVSRVLEENGVVCDVRKPNVIRVAPVPLYCQFEDAWKFVDILGEALRC